MAAGVRWATPRMHRPRRLLANLCATDVVDFLMIPARCSGLQDLSSLEELQLTYAGDNKMELGAMALEGLLRQASALMCPSCWAALSMSMVDFRYPLHSWASHVHLPCMQATALKALRTNLTAITPVSLHCQHHQAWHLPLHTCVVVLASSPSLAASAGAGVGAAGATGLHVGCRSLA